MPYKFTMDNGMQTVVYEAPKANLERQFGELTDEQYRELVLQRQFPAGLPDDLEVMPDGWQESADERQARFTQNDDIREARGEPRLQPRPMS